MKVLWLCNIMPGAVRAALGGSNSGGLWLDHVLSDVSRQDLELYILCLGFENCSGSLSAHVHYQVFTEGAPYRYWPELEGKFRDVLKAFAPDTIHVWGSEFGHFLAMVNAADALGLRERIVVSMQGICTPYARHYAEGIPHRVVHSATVRDFLRGDNIARQRRKFVIRGGMERQALARVEHVMGRTTFDRACTAQFAPQAKYHLCNETLREEFYQAQWSYAKCSRHRIFVSSCAYPIKGFHYLLEAFPIILERYPDAVICATGDSFFPHSIRDYLRQETYFHYLTKLCKKYCVENKIEFTGNLNAEDMRDAFLNTNVFVMSSTIENSPNGLGEAMLLGVPCVAADVGGVRDMMREDEGFSYPSTAPYLLAHYIMEVFAMEERAEAMGARAREHALQTHDPEKNLQQLLSVYREVAGL